MIANTLFSMGLSNMTMGNQLVFAFAVCACCVLAGWITNSLLAGAGFGVILNSVLMLICMSIGLVIYTIYVKPLRLENPVIIISVAAGSAVFGLILLAFVKKAVLKET